MKLFGPSLIKKYVDAGNTPINWFSFETTGLDAIYLMKDSTS